MGYEVYITRKQQWHDEEGPEITLDEWCSFVNKSTDMRLDGFAETALNDGEVLRLEKEGLSVWTEYSKHEDNGNMAWFYPFEGSVSVKNPDEEILKKMYQISQALGAKLQGEEGEVYDENGKSNWQELRTKPQPAVISNNKKWWQFWK